MAYVLGFAGNTWEVFGIRVWWPASRGRCTCLATKFIYQVQL
jgi:hypothetical protein